METNVLYYGDNLDILRRYIPAESVDLVYLDPPFAAGLTTLFSTLLWILVAEVRHHVGDMPHRLVRLITLRAAFVPAVLFVTIPLAFVDPRIPLVAWILLWPIQLAMERRFRLRLDAPRGPLQNDARP